MSTVEFISGTLVRLGDDKATTYELVSIEDDGWGYPGFVDRSLGVTP